MHLSTTPIQGKWVYGVANVDNRYDEAKLLVKSNCGHILRSPPSSLNFADRSCLT